MRVNPNKVAKLPTTVGNHDYEPGTRPIRLCHILPIVRHSLKCAYFISEGVVFKQIRGAAIGSPLSPQLCAAFVKAIEYAFLTTLNNIQLQAYGKSWIVVRYVDNRILMYSDRPHAKLFDRCFYGQTVILEEEPKTKIVGTHMQFVIYQLHFIYVVHGFPVSSTSSLSEDHRWRYRSPAACATIATNISGLLSRLHLNCRLSKPAQNIRAVCAQLTWIYLELGYTHADIWNAIKKIVRKNEHLNIRSRRRKYYDYLMSENKSRMHELGCHCTFVPSD